MPNQPMLIVGAGECGTRAAFALREHGYDGEIVLVGDDPDFPYERPPLSKQILLEAAEPQPRYIATPEQFAGARIQLLRGQRVSALDTDRRMATLTDAGGAVSQLGYEKLLLATGARPRPLPLAGMGDDVERHCTYLRTFSDARRIRAALHTIRHLVIVGGGLIGLELAASARQLGVEVTVLEAAGRILGRAVPASLAAVLVERHADAGVEVYCQAQIGAMEARDDGVRVCLQDGLQLDAGLVVIGIGAIPNTELAVQAGLRVENGIVADACLQTSHPDVYAAGDCCAFPLAAAQGRLMRLETWRNAQEQGTLAARNMLGAQEASAAVPWFWSDQYELGLQVAGLSSPQHRQVRRMLAGDAFIDFELDDNGRLVAAGGIGPGNAVAKDIRLAEMLIAKGASPAVEMLADSAVSLKKLWQMCSVR